MLPPIVTDIDVAVGMGLHENQLATGGGIAEFPLYVRGAILLLGRGVDQHVAVGQKPPEPLEIAGEVRLFGGIGIGTIDNHQVFQQRQIVALNFAVLERQLQQLEVHLGMHQQLRLQRGGPLPPGTGHLAAQQRVHQRAFSRSRPAEHRHHQRHFQSLAHAAHPGEDPLQKQSRLPGGFPGGSRRGPGVAALDQTVDPAQQLELT